MTNSEPESFGARLQRLMDAKRINQTQLADRTGIDRTQLNRMINSKAHPKFDQIAWLAEALDIGVEALMTGITWPPQVRRAIDQSRQAIERVVRAEAEREEALARAAHAETELAREREEREIERGLTEAARRVLDEQWRTRLREFEHEAARARSASETEINQLKSGLRKAVADVRQSRTTETALRRQLARVQQQLVDTQTNTAAGKLFAGLAGAVIGRVLD